MDTQVKLVVVRHFKTGQMIPFDVNERTGEIRILSSGVYNIDDYVVSYVPACSCDWDTGYVVEEESEWQRK